MHGLSLVCGNDVQRFTCTDFGTWAHADFSKFGSVCFQIIGETLENNFLIIVKSEFIAPLAYQT